MKSVCLHGAECTGKSVLAGKLGYPWVPEYGRTYCEERGTDLTMADLLAIAEGQAEENRRAMAGAPPLLVLDTDQLMTAAWAQMLFGEVPPSLLEYPKADLYLLFAPDVPWLADGTRLFGGDAERARFAALAEEMLVRAGVPFVPVSGHWEEREAQARAAIADLLGAPA
ncbi:ATP-binding protein [Novosphingobium mangrovi (ex Huang et al. 2023)]|uniref:ATP-binding protein n=1 Tax=Novosphingobium mangrovi (ex Huang et al. 2023) TaxID=2976432 RepID=A0ABT2I8K0_9SPHN|nr:ATP-binding protein [Novosphingobium mangrovi (ex Huang et al. 2023)]MCT2401133.1 ATP-binding protein [Novosphingobium mangrovi (ex Huang et al. 2023)]